VLLVTLFASATHAYWSLSTSDPEVREQSPHPSARSTR
jgi:hypothetical protein